MSGTSSWSEQDSWSESSGSSHSESETYTEGVAETQSHTVSQAITRGESESESRGTTISKGESEARNWATTQQNGSSVGVGNSTGTSTGTSQTRSVGHSESLAPIMEDRPAAVHNKENLTHMAAEIITHLPTGTAIVKMLFGSSVNMAVVQLPFVADLPEQIPGNARLQLLEQTPSARPAETIDELIAERRLWLKAQTAIGLNDPEEPPTARGFRVAAPKGKRAITPKPQIDDCKNKVK